MLRRRARRSSRPLCCSNMLLSMGIIAFFMRDGYILPAVRGSGRQASAVLEVEVFIMHRDRAARLR